MPAKKMKSILWSCSLEEVVYEILLRVPVKSLCRFRCVSKSWFSIISDPKFIAAHFDHSLANPKLLLTCVPRYSGTKYLSGPFSEELICSVDYADWGIKKWRSRPQSLIADSHGVIPVENWYFRVTQSVGGLILVKSNNNSLLIICNPSTRERIRFNLPACPGELRFCQNRSYLGFDPIEKKHKVLSSWIDLRPQFEYCWSYVLTLGEDAWRLVECKYTHVNHSKLHDDKHYHNSLHTGICINGVIYYLSRYASPPHMVAFDVRSETFKSISVHRRVPAKVPTCLIEYAGCAAAVYMVVKDARRVIVTTVLTDEEWKYEEYFVPDKLLPLVKKSYLVGSSPNGELVFVSEYYNYLSNHKLIKLDCYDTVTEEMKEIKVRPPKQRKRTWFGLSADRAPVKVCPHVERLESLQSLSPAAYCYQRY